MAQETTKSVTLLAHTITAETVRLTRKYYGYVADLEGSDVESFDLLFVRDKIQSILEQSTPEKTIPSPLFERIHELDRLLWEQCNIFLMVVGEKELQHARRQQGRPRSHWWWYLDEFKTMPLLKPHKQLAQAFALAA